ncbi:hypothetical protein BC834DRAFT_873176 [Gloeopeniophorella convolvens]|nr:hypothetical protein BC834DRAFT_873176 [Gloeopeniophorella convolvens]
MHQRVACTPGCQPQRAPIRPRTYPSGSMHVRACLWCQCSCQRGPACHNRAAGRTLASAAGEPRPASSASAGAVRTYVVCWTCASVLLHPARCVTGHWCMRRV